MNSCELTKFEMTKVRVDHKNKATMLIEKQLDYLRVIGYQLSLFGSFYVHEAREASFNLWIYDFGLRLWYHDRNYLIQFDKHIRYIIYQVSYRGN